jgi:hypothetical protein
MTQGQVAWLVHQEQAFNENLRAIHGYRSNRSGSGFDNMLTDKEIGDYLTYRFKLNELIHLHLLSHALMDGSCGEFISGVPREHVLTSVRTAAVAWLVYCTPQN